MNTKELLKAPGEWSVCKECDYIEKTKRLYAVRIALKLAADDLNKTSRYYYDLAIKKINNESN